MSTAITPSTVPVEPFTGHLLTVADVAFFPRELPSRSVDYELNNGRIVVVAPPGDQHGKTQLRIGSALLIQGELRGHGEARTEVGVILWRTPDRLVGADVAFVAAARLPICCSSEGYWETIPDFVAEVRSKNDRDSDVAQKVADYLQAGVTVVWVAEPELKTVTIHTSGSTPTVVTETETLTLAGIVPDFALPVRDIFPQ